MGWLENASDIAFTRVRMLEPAYVIYDSHHQSAVNTLTSFLYEHRILSTGRYGGWNYSSMEDALVFGRDAASTACEAVS